MGENSFESGMQGTDAVSTWTQLRRLVFIICFTMWFVGYKAGPETGSRIHPISFPEEINQCKVTHGPGLHYVARNGRVLCTLLAWFCLHLQ